MTEYHFSLILPMSRLTDEQILDLADQLAQNGCDDVSINGHPEGVEVVFDRGGESL